MYRDASHLWHSFSHNRTKSNIQFLSKLSTITPLYFTSLSSRASKLSTITPLYFTSLSSRASKLSTITPLYFTSLSSRASKLSTITPLYFTSLSSRASKLSFIYYSHDVTYEMNFTLCVLLVYNDNGSVQTLCITRVSAFCTKCLHRPIVVINQQYTKGEIHFIYLHYFHVFEFCFIDRYHGNGWVSLENPTVCTVNGRA